MAQRSCATGTMQGSFAPTGPHFYFPTIKLSEQNLLGEYWQNIEIKLRLLKFSDIAFLQVKTQKQEKTLGE